MKKKKGKFQIIVQCKRVLKVKKLFRGFTPFIQSKPAGVLRMQECISFEYILQLQNGWNTTLAPCVRCVFLPFCSPFFFNLFGNSQRALFAMSEMKRQIHVLKVGKTPKSSPFIFHFYLPEDFSIHLSNKNVHVQKLKSSYGYR